MASVLTSPKNRSFSRRSERQNEQANSMRRDLALAWWSVRRLLKVQVEQLARFPRERTWEPHSRSRCRCKKIIISKSNSVKVIYNCNSCPLQIRHNRLMSRMISTIAYKISTMATMETMMVRNHCRRLTAANSRAYLTSLMWLAVNPQWKMIIKLLM